ncbi:CLUMA_CG012392, isoform A [Clunio marinus]|uniref:CLUMA_CG012392, isoform A n=1 Tax=Clunio marinus TaxID=568069 RepID=A0A1J1IF50_9DIPT|nr:CLUMA_CG012392, isoform A [Clunio marinus]
MNIGNFSTTEKAVEREKLSTALKAKDHWSNNLYMEASQTIKCKSEAQKKERKGFQHPCGGIKYCYLNILPRDPLNIRAKKSGNERTSLDFLVKKKWQKVLHQHHPIT